MFIQAHDTVAVLNNTPELVNMGRKKTKVNYTAGEHYSIDEFEDIVASPSCSRLIIRTDRVTGNLDNAKVVKHILWQMTACAHSERLAYCSVFNPDSRRPRLQQQQS